MTTEIHPAILAAHHSWRCVQARAREQWLELMADDVTIEDPVGIGPTNPTGKGFSGKREAEQFWDNHLAPTQSVHITAHESFAAGSESAHVLTLTTTFPNGIKMSVHGIFTYTLNDEHKIKALRGFWSIGEAKIEKPAAR